VIVAGINLEYSSYGNGYFWLVNKLTAKERPSLLWVETAFLLAQGKTHSDEFLRLQVIVL